MIDYKNFLAKLENEYKLKSKNEDWRPKFEEYLNSIKKMDQVNKEITKINGDGKTPLGIYTSVSKSKSSKYDIRCFGQIVASVKNGKVEYDKKLREYFDGANDDPNLTPFEVVEMLKKLKEKKNLFSMEHKFESRILKFLYSDKNKEALRNMRPITIGEDKQKKIKGLFFQMPVFFKASKHGEEVYTINGGNIDILARIKVAKEKSDLENHLCIMELKDSITKGEEPKDIIRQAIAYACCIQKLLRSEQGEEWYNFFGFTKSIPNPLVLYACVVPFGKKFHRDSIPDIYRINEDIYFENGGDDKVKDKLCLRYLYLDMNEEYTEMVGAPETNLNLKR